MISAPESLERQQMIRTDGLLVVGAEYSLETGAVDFFDGVPEVGLHVAEQR